MDEIDIWRTANEVIKLYGDDAQLKAAIRADKLLELGDIEGFHTWKRVAAAIRDLTNACSRGQTLN